VRMPWCGRGGFVAELARRTGLSRASVYRRLSGKTDDMRRARKGGYWLTISLAQQVALDAALAQDPGRSAQELWCHVLGAPGRPAARTVGRWLASWRARDAARRQPDLPLGLPPSTAALSESERCDLAMGALRRAMGE
jgi:AcrR family transcriptional regulator